MVEFINKETFLDLVDGEVETFRPIIDDLEGNGHDLIREITAARQQNNLVSIRKAAHQLKGSTGMLGMEQMFEICKAIELKELEDIDAAYLSDFLEAFECSLSAARELMKGE